MLRYFWVSLWWTPGLVSLKGVLMVWSELAAFAVS
jgi:hypothetical protein